MFEDRVEKQLGLACGSGVEVPDWLERLGVAVERALERVDAGQAGWVRAGTLPHAVPWRPLSWDALQALLAKEEGGRRGTTKP